MNVECMQSDLFCSFDITDRIVSDHNTLFRQNVMFIQQKMKETQDHQTKAGGGQSPRRKEPQNEY